MANPAAEARAKVQAAHPEAVVIDRGRDSIKHRLADAPDGRKRFALDCAIGPLHYGPDNDQEIDTALVPSVAPWDWEMTKAGFEVQALSDLSAGQVIEYRSGSEWVRFQPMALQYSNDLDQIQPISMPGNVQAAVDDDTLTWVDGYGPGRSLSWQAQTARLAKRLVITALSDLPPVEQYIFDGGNPILELNLIFAHSSGVTPYVNGQPWSRSQTDTQGLVEFRDDQGSVLWWFNLPRSWDSDNNEQLGTFRFKKQGNSLYVSHRVPLGFVQGAVYPLTVDVDIDDQVGADLDDAREYEANSTTYDATNVHGKDNTTTARNWPGFRWTAAAWPANGDTIDVAYMEAYFNDSFNADPHFHIHAEDAASPPAFVTGGGNNITGRTRTAAGVEWDDTNVAPTPAFVQSPSIVSVIQEIVTDYTITTIVLIWEPGLIDSTHVNRVYNIRAHNGDTDLAAKLHIEYTAAGGGVTVTPFTATLSLSTLVPTASTPQIIAPGVINLLTATFTPIVGLSVIPPPIALSITSFAPTITTTNNIIVTPNVVILSLNAFVPVIKLVITPLALSLGLTTFVPTISVSDNKLVTIPTTDLSVSLFAPTVLTPYISTPPTLSLSLTAFIPAITTTGNKIEIPNVGTLSLSAFAPTTSISDHKVVTPSILSAIFTTFIPIITSTAGVTVIPNVIVLSLSTFVSNIEISNNQIITPPTFATILTTFVPIVTGIVGITVTPETLSLSLTEFVPTTITPHIITPPTLTLTITKFVPTAEIKTIVTPNVAALSSTAFIPTIKLPVTVTPNTIASALTLFLPAVSTSGGEPIDLSILTLTLTPFVPIVTRSTYSSFGAPFFYTAVNWGEKVEFYLEVYLKATSNTARARLINVTDGSIVVDSGLSTGSVSYKRLRSSALSLIDGKSYLVQFGTEDEASGAFKNAKIVVI